MRNTKEDIERLKNVYAEYHRDHRSLPSWDDLNHQFRGALIRMYFRGAADGRDEVHEHFRKSAGLFRAD